MTLVISRDEAVLASHSESRPIPRPSREYRFCRPCLVKPSSKRVSDSLEICARFESSAMSHLMTSIRKPGSPRRSSPRSSRTDCSTIRRSTACISGPLSARMQAASTSNRIGSCTTSIGHWRGSIETNSPFRLPAPNRKSSSPWIGAKRRLTRMLTRMQRQKMPLQSTVKPDARVQPSTTESMSLVGKKGLGAQTRTRRHRGRLPGRRRRAKSQRLPRLKIHRPNLFPPRPGTSRKMLRAPARRPPRRLLRRRRPRPSPLRVFLPKSDGPIRTRSTRVP